MLNLYAIMLYNVVYAFRQLMLFCTSHPYSLIERHYIRCSFHLKCYFWCGEMATDGIPGESAFSLIT